MALALYRKYRPRTFAEVIGQDHVTQPLSQALRSGRLNHAYLFSGPRGCGKTSSARILARSLNCEQGPTPEPCGVCASCKSLANDGAGSIDVVEIDAASHGGVDDARDLREKAFFAPASSRFKIYVIDEAHMISSAGFNALLKLVEEPPEHVKFIFATTEPEKVIGTIRSRTHHYPFRLVPPAQMLDYVQQLCVAEKVEVEGGVLPLVVRAGGGSVRDTLSLLDQLIAGSEGATVNYERAVALLGYTHGALLDEVVDAIAARDAGAVFGAVDRVVQTGQDPRRFVEDLLERLRDLIVVAATRDGAAAVLRGVPQDEIDRMSTQASAFGAAELSRAADVVNTALTEMTGATSPRLHLELMVARLLVPAADETERGALARVERLERRMGIDEHPSMRAVPDRPAVEPVDIRTARKAKESVESRVEEPVTPDAPAEDPTPPDVPVEVEPAPPVTLQQIRDAWPEVLEIVKKTKRTSWTVLFTSIPRAYTDDVLTVAFPNEADVASFRQPHGPGESVSEQLRGAIHEVLGVRVKFLTRHEAAADDPKPAPAEPDDSAPANPVVEPAVPENPLPPAAEWNVIAIPGQTPAEKPDAPEKPQAATATPTTATVGQPATEASSETRVTPASDPVVSSPTAARKPPQQHTADGKARYGEAVVREILGANFIEEHSLAPADPPAVLDTPDD